MLACFVALIASLVVGTPIESQDKDFNSLWYDAGLYGAFVGRYYESFDLVSPQVNFLSRKSCDQGLTFISPRGRSVPSPGPLVLDADGELVWMEDKWGQAMDLKVQKYDGQDFITFWRGSDSGWHGTGTYYMLNSSYDVVHELKAANNLEGDLHEFRIVGGSALITLYEVVPADLSPVGGPEQGWIFDCLFQEIDVKTGDLILQWRASEHYDVESSFAPLYGHGGTEDDPWDWFHINAVDKDGSGNYYVSSRYMHTVTSVSPAGQLLWKLGGKDNEFQDMSGGAATNFTWQHHVSWHSGDILTIFDNAAYDGNIESSDQSRGLKVALDLENMTATLLQAYINPGVLSHSQGSVQILPSGNVFVDWGHNSGYTEFSSDGKIVCDAHFGSTAYWGWGWVKSYRGFKANWVGTPLTAPSIAMKLGWKKKTILLSWNGATEVKHWRLETASSTGAEDEKFSENLTVKKAGFETRIESIGQPDKYIRAAALDTEFQVLGYTETLDVRTGLQPLVQDDLLEDSDLLPVQSIIALCLFVSAGVFSWKFFSICRSRRTKYCRMKV